MNYAKAFKKNKSLVTSPHKGRGTQTLGQILKSARELKGISQAVVAKKLGYDSAQFISNIERDVANPPLAIISKMIELYDIAPEVVLSIMVNQYAAKVARALSLKK